MINIQRRARVKKITFCAKLEVVHNRWDHLIFAMTMKATIVKDEGMKKLLKSINMVNREVRDFLLRKYLKQCQKIHLFAFVQWRLNFARKRLESDATCQMPNQEVSELVDDNIEYLFQESQKNFNHFHMLDQTIEEGAFLHTKKSLSFYGVKPETAIHSVNKFHQLGWSDPFPISKLKDDKDSQKNYKKKAYKSNIKKFSKECFFTDGALIYNRKRNCEDFSPMCVYIPSRDLIFKMMRACIGCEKIEDLWIYNE